MSKPILSPFEEFPTQQLLEKNTILLSWSISNDANLAGFDRYFARIWHLAHWLFPLNLHLNPTQAHQDRGVRNEALYVTQADIQAVQPYPIYRNLLWAGTFSDMIQDQPQPGHLRRQLTLGRLLLAMDLVSRMTPEHGELSNKNLSELRAVTRINLVQTFEDVERAGFDRRFHVDLMIDIGRARRTEILSLFELMLLCHSTSGLPGRKSLMRVIDETAPVWIATYATALKLVS